MAKVLGIGRIPRFQGNGMHVIFGTHSAVGTVEDCAGQGSFNLGVAKVLGGFGAIANQSGTRHHIQTWGTRAGYLAYRREFLGTKGDPVGTSRAIPISFIAFTG